MTDHTCTPHQPARPSQKLHGNHDSLHHADQLTGHDLCRCHGLSRTGLEGPHSVENHDTVSLRLSQTRRNGDTSVPGCFEASPTQHRPSNTVTSYSTSNNPSVPPSRATEGTIQPYDIASNQSSRTFDQPQSLAGEILPQTGKGKGRIPNVGQNSGARQELVDVQEPGFEREPSIDGIGHPYNPSQHPQLYCPLIASYQHGRVAQSKRRQYQEKSSQHLQGEASNICTAVSPDKCRVHGKISPERYLALTAPRKSRLRISVTMSLAQWVHRRRVLPEFVGRFTTGSVSPTKKKQQQDGQLRYGREIGAVWALVMV